MKHRVAGVVFLALCAAQAGRADLTMRHTFTLKFASFLPPQALDAIKQQLGDRLSQGSTLELKGDRVRTAMGDMYSVADYAKGEILLVDPKTKRFATVPLAEYAAKVMGSQVLPAMPPDAQRIFDNMKLDVKTSKTGKTETTHGIRTEENVLTISMEMGAGMQMRMEIHNWTASAEELNGMPALHDLANWAGRKREGLDPMEMMSKAMTSLPGLGEKLRAPMQEMMKGTPGVVLRMQALTFVPAMAQLAGGSDEPLSQVSMELVELSTAPVADARFEVPAGYHTAAMEDLIKDAIGTVKPTTQGVPTGAPEAAGSNWGGCGGPRRQRSIGAADPRAPGAFLHGRGEGGQDSGNGAIAPGGAGGWDDGADQGDALAGCWLGPACGGGGERVEVQARNEGRQAGPG